MNKNEQKLLKTNLNLPNRTIPDTFLFLLSNAIRSSSSESELLLAIQLGVGIQMPETERALISFQIISAHVPDFDAWINDHNRHDLILLYCGALKVMVVHVRALDRLSTGCLCGSIRIGYLLSRFCRFQFLNLGAIATCPFSSTCNTLTSHPNDRFLSSYCMD